MDVSGPIRVLYTACQVICAVPGLSAGAERTPPQHGWLPQWADLSLELLGAGVVKHGDGSGHPNH